MKELLGIGFFIIAALATPVSVVYGLHEWVIVDVEFKFALWEAAKLWLSMIAMVIPGGIILVLSK